MTTVQTKVLMPEKKKKVTLAQVILVTIIMLFVLICVLPIINVASVSLKAPNPPFYGATWPFCRSSPRSTPTKPLCATPA